MASQQRSKSDGIMPRERIAEQWARVEVNEGSRGIADHKLSGRRRRTQAIVGHTILETDDQVVTVGDSRSTAQNSGKFIPRVMEL